MKTLRTLLAVIALGTSLAPAFAEEDASRAAVVVTPVIEGRQSAPIAAPTLTTVDQLIIDRNAPSH